ncbi:MAG: fibronectin type III domain-containing protein [Acidimicrobiales bacterium]
MNVGPAVGQLLHRAGTRLGVAAALFLLALPLVGQAPGQAAVPGVISAFAGTGVGGFSGDGGPATDATIDGPSGLVVDPHGNALFGDIGASRVRRVDQLTGVITTVAGNGSAEFSGDGGPATAAGMDPVDVAVDAAGAVYVLGNGRVRRVDPLNHTITTVAGTGVSGPGASGVLATFVNISPSHMTVDAAGNVILVNGANSKIFRVDVTTGFMWHMAGNGVPGFSGDGGLAVNASFNSPNDLALDADGNLFVADWGNFRVRRIDHDTGIVTTVAGDGVPAFDGDGGPATDASLWYPRAVDISPFGDLLIADQANNRIRRVDHATGFISTVAGNGTAACTGDGGAATSAGVWYPNDVKYMPDGGFLVVQNLCDIVRKVEGAAPFPLPSAPLAVQAIPASTRATVSWSPPLDDGGTPIESYTVVSVPWGRTCTWTAGPLQCTVTGLFDGVEYRFLVIATNGTGSGPPSALSAPVTANPVSFVPTGPTRAVDSRLGLGTAASPWGPSETRVVPGAPPEADVAVVLNVTAVHPSAPTHLTVWPAGRPMPTASNLNIPAGEVRPAAVIVSPGPGGGIAVFNNAGSVDVIVDVVGYFAATGPQDRFGSVPPTRVLDSRDTSPWGPGQTSPVQVAGGTTGVPVDATAVAVNVTVTGPTETTHVVAWPTGTAMPATSNLNVGAGQTAANIAIVSVGTGGNIDLYNNSGSAHIIIDVVGYFGPSGTSSLIPVTPTRVLDSRDGTGGYSTPWGPHQSRAVSVGRADGMTTQSAAIVNLTGVFPTAATHITGWATGAATPPTSNINLPAGDVRANVAIIGTGPADSITLYNNDGTTHLVADVLAHFE